MNIINQLINEHALDSALAGDWESVAKTLNAPTIDRRDDTLRSTGWLMQQLTAVVDPTTGATEADLVLGTLQRATVPRVRAAYDRMSAVGIDLSEPQVQAMLPFLAVVGKWPAGLVDRIAAAGLKTISPAESVGLESVTSEVCQSAYESASLQRDWTTLQNEVINPTTNDRKQLVLALRSAADALESGR